MKEQIKIINYYDTFQQRRQHGNSSVNIMSTILGFNKPMSKY